MFIKVRDIDNDINLVNIKKIVSMYKNTDNNTTFLSFGNGDYLEIDKNIEEVERRFFQLGIKVTEF